MKSEELQRLTASEPLTLEQEYAMQRSWREDADSEKPDPGLGGAGLAAGGPLPFFPSCSPAETWEKPDATEAGPCGGHPGPGLGGFRGSILGCGCN